ncbi:MAG: hypothetical protein JO197_03920 [Acidobacteria bacterium]|nr:hypothetical protein [Acidobacteriota bacterium]MBV9071345.1 hypothetical protein [Acidobacteriota bacterium]MBV9476467.1 hypothetical protein [Acidobacteriota bacterium]
MLSGLVLALTLTTGFIAGHAAADQPRMHAALEHLRAAKTELERADNDKGGHRARALELVNGAIAQVEEGMKFDRRH